ncbi:anti-sigma B factor antagonist [Thermocatellispora tengchongensis]|uniref:Anti-sigma factor antagonist n=1 Tax=Thermocatellispora tengchongensis TaxID=1073253 RepID=A0A840PP98_9ACTN|nr:STAS domain-containing protein [Thermocatellispora tengchongensis]MBB5138897.1 anti-sigma B factor antagonist [Thermocatellispora tengchongensis]
MTEPIELSSRRLPGGVVVISVAGELDAHTGRHLEAYLGTVRERPDDRLVIDLSEVPFLDSGGLRVLLDAHVRAREHASRVHLAAPRRQAARVLTLTRADRYLRVHETVDEAVSAALADAPGEDPGGTS